MREIKFRAWDKYRDEFVNPAAYVSLFNANSDKNIATATPDGIHITLLQYTGLKDKNGKDVYEGDKLRCYFNKDEIEDYLWATMTNYQLAKGYFDKEVTIPEIYQEALPDKFEVIGNIYEN